MPVRSANCPALRVEPVYRTSQAQTPVSLGPGNSIVKPAGHPFWAIPYHVGNPIQARPVFPLSAYVGKLRLNWIRILIP